MGLDMYLTARKHVNAWDEEDADQKGLSAVPVQGAQGLKVSAIEYRAAYWRKANAIHNWFVENVQGGEDNCAQYEVTAQQLEELRDECQRVLDDPTLAATVLPTASGFFFGPTDYDQGYIDDLEHTIEAVDRVLAVPRDYNWTFFYQSSW
jgi:hypothetical protein